MDLVRARLEYPDSKTKTITRVEELAKSYNVVAVSSLNKLRATQLMALRKNFRKEMKIFVAKNKLASMGLKKSGLKNIQLLIENLQGQNALIFTNINPFKLNMLLEKNRVLLPARAGDLATDPILVPAGNTGLPPGPVLSDFKETGIPTRIDTGSVWIAKDTIVRQKGEVISPKLAALLQRLGIKPIQAGVSISSAYSDGLIFREEEIRLNLEEYRRAIQNLFNEALALAVQVDYYTVETMPRQLSKALKQGIAIAIKAGYLTNETTARLLVEHHLKAETLREKLRSKGYA